MHCSFLNMRYFRGKIEKFVILIFFNLIFKLCIRIVGIGIKYDFFYLNC